MIVTAPTPPSRLLTCKEAADYLRISTRTLFNLTKRGDLPSVRLSLRAVRYRAEDLTAFAERLVAQGVTRG